MQDNNTFLTLTLEPLLQHEPARQTEGRTGVYGETARDQTTTRNATSQSAARPPDGGQKGGIFRKV